MTKYESIKKTLLEYAAELECSCDGAPEEFVCPKHTIKDEFKRIDKSKATFFGVDIAEPGSEKTGVYCPPIDCTVMICDDRPDRQGDTFDIKGITFPKWVPVTLDFQNNIPPLGKAKLRTVGDKIMATVELNETDNAEEMKTLIGMVPAIGGKTGLERKSGKPNLILELNIESIGLCRENSDYRIAPLKDGV